MKPLDDVRSYLATDEWKAFADLHPIDAHKVELELAGNQRPDAGARLARILIAATRYGLSQGTPSKPLELPPLPELGRKVMFTAWNPAAALRCPPSWRVALSADPAYESAVRAFAPKIKANGNLVAVWGNQSQTGAERIRTLADSIGAHYTIMQAETPFEYVTAIQNGAKLIVGNPNAWTDSQRADATDRANRGDLAVMMEVYTNAGEPWPDVASSRNVPIVSEVVGVGWGTNPYQLADYAAHTPPGVWATMGVYLAENMSAGSWDLLP